jgi:hypothetical protein
MDTKDVPNFELLTTNFFTNTKHYSDIQILPLIVFDVAAAAVAVVAAGHEG